MYPEAEDTVHTVADPASHNPASPPDLRVPPSRPAAEEWHLSLETCNGTCWASCKSWLERTPADVVLLQEHHLQDSGSLSDALAWLSRAGWNAVSPPAVPGDKDDVRSTTGGVGLAVRKHLDLLVWDGEGRRH